MRLVDTHCHLQAEPFTGDIAEVIAAAELAGVERLLVPGWDEASSIAALALSDRFPNLAGVAVGVHPHAAAETDAAACERVSALATDPRVVAIGETGLDFDRMFSPPGAQLANLRRNLALALATGKPAILHCRSKAGARDAQDALIGELRAAGFGTRIASAAFGERPPAVLHSVSGPVDYVEAALGLGCAVSISGLAFRRGEEATAESVRLAPPFGDPARGDPHPFRLVTSPRAGSPNGGARTRTSWGTGWSRITTGCSRARPRPPSRERGGHASVGTRSPAGPAQPRRRQRSVIDAISGRPGSTSVKGPVFSPFGGPVWGSTQTPSACSV